MLWSVLERGDWTVDTLAKASKMSKATLFRCLYGDREMRLGPATELEKLTGIPAIAWTQPPAEPFEVPSTALEAPPAPASSDALESDAKKPSSAA